MKSKEVFDLKRNRAQKLGGEVHEGGNSAGERSFDRI